MWLTKQKQIPVNQSTSAESCVQLWYVKWWSRDGNYSSNLNKEMEAFTSEKEALEFKSALENAYRLLKYTAGTEVTIERAR